MSYTYGEPLNNRKFRSHLHDWKSYKSPTVYYNYTLKQRDIQCHVIKVHIQLKHKFSKTPQHIIISFTMFVELLLK